MKQLRWVLQKQRELSGFTQEELAERAGAHKTLPVKINKIRRSEQRESDPKISTLVTLAEVMGVRPSALMMWAESRAELLDEALPKGRDDVASPHTGTPLIREWTMPKPNSPQRREGDVPPIDQVVVRMFEMMLNSDNPEIRKAFARRVAEEASKHHKE